LKNFIQFLQDACTYNAAIKHGPNLIIRSVVKQINFCMVEKLNTTSLPRTKALYV